MIKKNIFFLLFFFILSIPAYSDGGKDFSEIGGQLTLFLPTGVKGMDKVIPGLGPRFSFNFWRGMAEFAAIYSANSPVSSFLLDVGYRINIPLDVFSTFFGFGLQSHIYTYKNDAGNQVEPLLEIGPNFFVGMLTPIAKDVFLRGDFKLYINPGVIVFLGGGIVLTI